MNRTVTSQSAILEASRALALAQGFPAVSIRAVASACGVAVGSIYNYYPSKTDLVLATVESIWQDIFAMPSERAPFDSFLACVSWVFERMQESEARYPGFFSLHTMSALGEDRAKGLATMRRAWGHMEAELRTVLRRDARIRPDAFDDHFTPEDAVSLTFSLILSSLLRPERRGDIALEVLRRLLY